MRDQSLGVLLIPLLAVLSISLPVLSRSARSGAATQATATPSPASAAASESSQPKPALPRPLGVAGLLRGFGEDKKGRARRCVIATVPDPIDAANVGYTFDRYVDAMQRAMEAANYTLDRFDLPWRDVDAVASAAAVTEGFQDGKLRKGPRFRAEPGVLLFRGRGEEKGTFALLFLVGETPTAGVHKRALQSAVAQYRNHCPARPIRLLAPAFSGSVTSLRSALADRPPSNTDPLPAEDFTIISGSATVVDPNELHKGFRATVPPDGATLRALAAELQRLEGGRPLQIGLLTEANTGYGSAVQSTPSASDTVAFRSLPFPLHVAQLRQVSQPAGSQSAEGDLSGQTRHRLTSLDLRSTTEPHNVVPLFSKIETSSIEMTLSTLLQTISREQLRYICIFASDVHDRIFLVQELRHHAPNTVLIAPASDLLYLHPDVNLVFRGMLVISPYPLFASNQFWTDGASARTRRLLFPAHTAQGVYNAAVALLNRPDLMQEYGQPFRPKTPMRPWLSIVGSNGIWPVRLLDVPTARPASPTKGERGGREASSGSMSMADYLYQQPADTGSHPQNADNTLPAGALEPESHPWFLVILALASLLSASSLLAQFGSRASRDREEAGNKPLLEQWTATSRLSALFGDQVYRRHRFERRLYLLTSIAAFLFLLLLSGVIAAVVPVTFTPDLSMDGRPYWARGWRLALALLVLLAFVATVVATWVVWRMLAIGVWRARRWMARPRSRIRPHVMARASALISMSLALLLVLTMTLVLCGEWLRSGSPDAAMLAARSMDLSNGVSPLLPLLFIGAAAIVWAVSALRRLRLLDGVDRRDRFLGLASGSFEGVGTLERDVLIAAGRPSLKLAPRAMVAITLLLLAAWVRLFLVRSTPTVEGMAYDWLFRVAFLLVYFALLVSFLRFCLMWLKLRRLLLRLSWHPTISAYDRLRQEIPGKPKVGLAAATQVYTALEFSVDRASRLIALADRMVRADAAPPGPPSAGESQNAMVESVLRVFGIPMTEAAAAAAPQTSTARALTAHVVSIRKDLSHYVQHAQLALKEALASEARHDWRSAIRKRSRAEANLSRISRLVAAALERAWRLPADLRPEPVTSAQKNQPSDEELWFEYGEDFIASRVASFVSHLVPQLQNLIIFLTVGMLLMLLAVTSYPFQPQQLLIGFNWMFVTTVAVTVLVVLVQMERDTVLSVLSDTTPGQITWNRDFISRILIYVVVPIVGLLGAQFPDVTQAFLNSMSTLVGG